MFLLKYVKYLAVNCIKSGEKFGNVMLVNNEVSLFGIRPNQE